MSTIALHHILLKSPLLADDVLKELALGADFGELANEYSACPSARQQGFSGYHNTDQLPAELLKALYQHEDDSPYCGPIKTDYGYHIVKMTEKPQRTMLIEE